MKKLSYLNPTCSLHGNVESRRIIRHGFYRTTAGKRRRYRCVGCGKTFSSTKGTPYYRLQHRRATFDTVVTLRVEGVSLSAIARIERLAWNTGNPLARTGCRRVSSIVDTRCCRKIRGMSATRRRCFTVEECGVLDSTHVARAWAQSPQLEQSDPENRSIGVDHSPDGTDQLIETELRLKSTSSAVGQRRWWLLCPLLLPWGKPCGGRVKKLYLPPGAVHFGCRRCHRLTYRSVQQHDKRLDYLRLHPERALELVEAPNPKISTLLLVIRAMELGPYKPGDQDYNGGRWHLNVIVNTALCAKYTDADRVEDLDIINDFMSTNMYFECPLLPRRGNN